MNILVTGGAGFIGSHIVDALLEKGHAVSVLDDLSTGKRANIDPQADFHELDITDLDTINTTLHEIRPEVIFHLSAQIDVRRSVADPVSDARSNILASINLLETARREGVHTFIFSSSGGTIYGDTDERPTPEEHPELPLSPYGIAKLAIDKFLYTYNALYGMRTLSLRYGNVYGPRQNAHGEAGVVAIFLDKMLKGEQPTINGTGTQTRDYVYVEDVVSANLLALGSTHAQGTFNIGTGIETDVNTIFSLINQHFENTFKDVRGPAKPGEQRTSCLNASKITRELGWKPKTSLDKGIKRTYEWFRQNTK